MSQNSGTGFPACEDPLPSPKSNNRGQSVVEFLGVLTLIAGMILIAVQAGAILLKADQIQFSAFWASRASCVGGDGEKSGMQAFGSEVLSQSIDVDAGNGTGECTYRLQSGVFPMIGKWLGTSPRSHVTIRGSSVLFPDPGGPDGDN